MRIDRTGIRIMPDCSRVVLRPFNPYPDERAPRILQCILNVNEADAENLLKVLYSRFENRHRRFRTYLSERYEKIRSRYPDLVGNPSNNLKLLIGAYFSQEYAFECAALFNPSIVWHPDQSGMAPDERRFVVSLRATGEGHLSSLCFRVGTINANNEIKIENVSRFAEIGVLVLDSSYDRDLFARKLKEIGTYSHIADEVLAGLESAFTLQDLKGRLEAVSHKYEFGEAREHEFLPASRHILALAQCNYEVTFEPDQPIGERTLFPIAPNELNGIEDARFVQFTDDDGSTSYYATYTAYNGSSVVPQLIETDDFLSFNVSTLNGPQVHNKGIAMFPRKLDGKYAMLSRQGNENMYLMKSEHSHFWYEKEEIAVPIEPWEFVQIGNCGSPIETERGWLVLTHGVGPMRTYSISALLLDLDNPSKVIGRLHEPLLAAEGDERDGYVPNVVYSCGALINGNSLILPYAVSDHTTSFAVASLSELLDCMAA